MSMIEFLVVIGVAVVAILSTVWVCSKGAERRCGTCRYYMCELEEEPCSRCWGNEKWERRG